MFQKTSTIYGDRQAFEPFEPRGSSWLKPITRTSPCASMPARFKKRILQLN
jgi:hypothetical protein